MRALIGDVGLSMFLDGSYAVELRYHSGFNPSTTTDHGESSMEHCRHRPRRDGRPIGGQVEPMHVVDRIPKHARAG